jgi:histone-lysine N-methyltransferase SETMAR
LADFDEKRAQNLPKNRSRSILLHLDNAMPHHTPRDFDHLGITRLSHPPYSPDLVPCDLWLFETLKRRLEECTFGNPIEVMMAMSIILGKTHLDEFILVFDKLKCRLCECIDRKDKYL